jgi:hypothetical protein
VHLLYKDESVYGCMCVCPAACRRTHTSHHPKIWHGLLISPGLGTEPGGDPKCWPPGVPPIVTPSEKPWRVNIWEEASKQKLLLGVGLPGEILFAGGSPQPWGGRVHPTKGGICFENWAGAIKQKLLLGVDLPGKILFVGDSPQPRARRVHPSKRGYMFWELGGGQQTKVAPWGEFAW